MTLTLSSFAEQDTKALTECKQHKQNRIYRPSTIKAILEDTYGNGPATKAINKTFTTEEQTTNYYDNN